MNWADEPTIHETQAKITGYTAEVPGGLCRTIARNTVISSVSLTGLNSTSYLNREA